VPAATVETSHGEFTIELDAEASPKAVESFLELARKGFFDGTAFHRIVPGFVIQGGDPTGTGTAGSQFFVVTADDAGLPPEYAVIGTVTEGLDVVMRIGELGDAAQKPTERVEIGSVTVEPDA
jgi:cyclophilin family peptidyl-prolyl cis-trans isomerase